MIARARRGDKAAFGQLVMSRLFLEGLVRTLDGLGKRRETISIAVHPRSVSNLRGHKNLNLEKLRRLYPEYRIEMQCDPTLDEMEFAVSGMAPVSILSQPIRLRQGLRRHEDMI